ncbi:hypothetical protein R6Q59_031430 [Mikania micrantha]
MSNPHENKSVEQYHSQPTKSSLNWVLNKCRRLSLKHFASSSGVPKTTMDDATKIPMDDASKVPMNDASKVVMEDAPKNNESHMLSRDAVEFYNNGDAPFSYSGIFGLNKVHTDFWGVLLGYFRDGRLLSIHIEGWVRRVMLLRGANQRKNLSIEFDWTVLPSQFHSEMYDYKTKFGSEYANGMSKLYPPFWEDIEDWLLVQIILCTMELTQ